VRERVNAGGSIAGLVELEVGEYIAEHGLYRARSVAEANTNTKAQAGAR